MDETSTGVTHAIPIFSRNSVTVATFSLIPESAHIISFIGFLPKPLEVRTFRVRFSASRSHHPLPPTTFTKQTTQWLTARAGTCPRHDSVQIRVHAPPRTQSGLSRKSQKVNSDNNSNNARLTPDPKAHYSNPIKTCPVISKFRPSIHGEMLTRTKNTECSCVT